MKNRLAMAIAFACATVSAPLVAQNAPAAAQKAKFSVEMDMGTLLDNPGTKAVLQKHVAWLLEGDGIQQARAMTLKQIQTYVPDRIPDALIALIDADLAKVQ